MFYYFMFAGNTASAADKGDVVKETLTPRTEKAEKIKEKREAAQKEKRLAPKKKPVPEVNGLPENIHLPEDSTLLLSVSSIEITGNKLLTTDELLKNVPSVYNTSNEKIEKTDPVFLYDLRSIKNVLESPGQTHQVSARTIQGFEQYLSSVYQAKGYGGVYIYIPAETFSEKQELKNGILQVKVIETTISQVNTAYFDVDGNTPKKTYLKPQIIKQWSPAKPGQPINKKKLDDFLNLLNLDPDRYVTATVSKDVNDTLNVGYNIYEVSPWHYFLQIDNSGTKDQQWSPRIGLINTNLTGRDDTLTAVLQVPLEKLSVHRYSAFISYDVPLFSPRLRLNVYGGRSEFNVNGGQGIDFLGNGSVVGSTLTYNLFQKNNWFFDVFSGFSFEKSKVTASLFPEFLGSEVDMDLWHVGAKLHKTDDMSKTNISIERIQRIGGSGQDAYWDAAAGTGARTNADKDFWIWNFNATRYQYLDAAKVHRVLGTISYILPNERLVPAKMTTFGGMYTVRGYSESGIVADGGILASVQYEYDLVKHSQAKLAKKGEPQGKPKSLRKLAPLVFFDYGRANIKDAVAGEKSHQELYSVGTGLLCEWGKYLSGGIYYGYPLKATSTTGVGDGRINVFAMLQW
jgi:hemolysin activation/secretion protein